MERQVLGAGFCAFLVLEAMSPRTAGAPAPRGGDRIAIEERCRRGPAGLEDGDYLTACRPPPVTPVQKDALVSTLPEHGHVTELTPAQRARMEALTPVLRLHSRESVYDVRVVDLPQAGMFHYGRAVILVTLPTLGILHVSELQAVFAHEIGHEYLLAEWEAARVADDRARLRQIEVACDEIAALTLTALGIPTMRLASAIVKIERYNRMRLGAALDADRYPSAAERQRLLQAFTTRKRRPPVG